MRWKRGPDKLNLHFFTRLVEVERSQGESQGLASASFWDLCQCLDLLREDLRGALLQLRYELSFALDKSFS